MSHDEPTVLEKAQADLQAELRKWDVLQVDIGSITTAGGLVRISQRIDTIIAILMEKEIVTQEELDLKFNQIALESLQEIRAQMEPAIVAAKLEAIKNGKLQ